MWTSANSFIIVRSLSLAVMGFYEVPPFLSIDCKVMFQSPPTMSLSVSVLEIRYALKSCNNSSCFLWDIDITQRKLPAA